jgi:predicted Zn-dependent peptidase
VELLTEVREMLAALAAELPEDDLARARNQLRVRVLRDAASPVRRLELAAQDLFTLGAVREPQAQAADLQAVPAEAVRAVFARLLDAPAALGLSGSVPTGLRERAAALFRL